MNIIAIRCPSGLPQTEPGSVNTPPLIPSPQTVRWCARRKALVVDAIIKGMLTLDDAMAMYSLSADELGNWLELYKEHGIRGLRLTRCQDYRANVKRRA